jgi:hypothetical protein
MVRRLQHNDKGGLKSPPAWRGAYGRRESTAAEQSSKPEPGFAANPRE